MTEVAHDSGKFVVAAQSIDCMTEAINSKILDSQLLEVHGVFNNVVEDGLFSVRYTWIWISYGAQEVDSDIMCSLLSISWLAQKFSPPCWAFICATCSKNKMNVMKSVVCRFCNTSILSVHLEVGQ